MKAQKRRTKGNAPYSRGYLEGLIMEHICPQDKGLIQVLFDLLGFGDSPIVQPKTPEKELSYLERSKLIGDLIDQMPMIIEAVANHLRDNWNSLSDSEKNDFKLLSINIQKARKSRRLGLFIKVRCSLLVPSLLKGKDLYPKLVVSFYQLGDTIASIIEGWEEINAELSESIAVNQGSIYDDDEEDLEFVLASSVVRGEVVDWGKPRGAEVW